MDFWDYFQPIAAICLILFAAYYVSRLVAQKNGGVMRKISGFKLLGNLPLGKDKSVAIVEIGKKAYILGLSSHNVEFLDKLELSELELDELTQESASFSSYLKGSAENPFKRFGKNRLQK